MKIRRYLFWILSLLAVLMIGTAYRPYNASTTIMVEILDDDAPSDVIAEFYAMTKADLKALLKSGDSSASIEELKPPPAPTGPPPGYDGRYPLRQRYDRRLFKLTTYNMDRYAASAKVNAAAHFLARELYHFEKKRVVYDGPVEVGPPPIHLERDLFQRLVLRE